MELTIKHLVNSKFKYFKVTSGTNKEINNLILANTTSLDSLINQAPDGFSNDGNSVDIEYKNKRIAEMKQQLIVLDSLIIKKNITDKTFVNWSKAQIRYRAGNDLSLYPFFGTLNKKIDAKKEYFNFINEVNPKNNDEFTYQSYLNYLATLSTSFKIMSSISEKYASDRENLKKDSLSNFPIVFNIIKNLKDSKERELLMAYSYYENKTVPEKYQDSLKYFVSNKLMAQVKWKEKDEKSNIITLIKNYDLPKNEKTELLKLYEETKGKIVFHDFWFTNCTPCMKELPSYNDLISATNSENIEFIFYGVYTENKEWKKTIDKFKLKGKHHLLTKNQLAFFEKYFRVHGFLHHQLIKSNGEIGENVNFGIYPNNFEKIINKIEKYRSN